MIASFRDRWLERFFTDGTPHRAIPPELARRVRVRLQMLDDAEGDIDLRAAPGNHFEKLRGHLDGYHSIRVSQQWRLVFRWDSATGQASDVYLDDHSYR